MRRVILLRHGQSEINAVQQRQPVFCGQLDTPLTNLGRQQAREVGRLLADPRRFHFSHAVSSALQELLPNITSDLLLVAHCQTIRCLISAMTGRDLVQSLSLTIPNAQPMILTETSAVTWELAVDT